MEKKITTFLSNRDDPKIPNPVHSTEGAKQFGYEKALVTGISVISWCIDSLLEVK